MNGSHTAVSGFSLLLMLMLTASTSLAAETSRYRFDNGLWYDGAAFTAKTAYVVDGKLKFSEQDLPAESTVDLDGGYVVPPFCEGHNHNIGGSADGVEEQVASYLESGVFYAMMPGSFQLYRSKIKDQLNHPKSIDIAFANNGITGSGGHPRGLREFLKKRFGLYPEFTNETLPDKGYFEADTLEQLKEKWALVLAEQTDFIKAVLFFSEEYEQRKKNPDFYGKRGLNPDLLPNLVEMAHKEKSSRSGSR